MKKLTIKNIEDYNYILEDENNNDYSVNMQFYDVEDPKSEDSIIMDEYLLDEHIPLSFGPLSGKYGKNVKENDADVIEVITKTKKMKLKRYYG